MFAYNTFPIEQGKHTSKRKIKAHFIQRNLQVLAILLGNYPEIYEVYAKRIRIPAEKECESGSFKNKEAVPHKRAILLEFYCKRHIPIVRVRQLEISLKRLFLEDIFGGAMRFLFVRLSPKGEYKCMSQEKEIQNLYKSPRALGLYIFQRPLPSIDS